MMPKVSKWFQRWLCLGLPKWTAECFLDADGTKGTLFTCQVNEPGNPDENVEPSCTLVYEWWVGLTKTTVDQAFVDELEPCDEPAAATTTCKEIVVWRASVDNHENADIPVGAVMWPRREWTIKTKWSDGSVSSAVHPAVTAAGSPWGQSNDQLAAAINQGCPTQDWSGPSADPGDDNPQGADGDLSTPYGAHAHARVCAGEKIPVEATACQYNAAGDLIASVPLAVNVAVETVEVWECKIKGKPATYEDADGGPIVLTEAQKKCLFDCGAAPDTPTMDPNPCTVETVEVCDIRVLVDADGLPVLDDDDQVQYEALNTETVFLSIVSCPDGSQSFSTWTFDGTDPVQYTPIGDFIGDCDTLEPINAEPAKPQGDIVSVEWFQASFGVSVRDNNLGVPASWRPIAHYQNTIDFANTMQGGGTFADQQIPTGSWSQQFETADGWLDTDRTDSLIEAWATAIGKPAVIAADGLSARIGNCVIQIGCHYNGCAGFPGLHPDAQAQGITVFYRHMSFICCGDDLQYLPVTSEVTATSNNAGGRVDAGFVTDLQPKIVTTKFRKVTVCLDDGSLASYLIDSCDNVIDPRTLPPCDCWTPCTPGGSPDLVNTSCEIEAAQGICEATVERFDSSNVSSDTAVVNPDTGMWNITPSQTNANTPMNNLLEKLNQGCVLAAVYVEETEVSASQGWIVVPAAAVSGDSTGFTINPATVADFGACDPDEALAAFAAGSAGMTISNGGAFQAGPLVPSENNNLVFAVPSDGTANGRCLFLTETPGVLPEPSHQPVHDACVAGKLDQVIDLLQQLVDKDCCDIMVNCCDACVPSCAWGAGGIDREQIWQASEGGIIWTICGETYTTPAGDYTNAELAAWLTANTPHTMTLVDPDPASPEKNVILYLSIPCDCPAPTFQFGDDTPITLAAIKEFDVTCEGDDDDDAPPAGDETRCATEKLGADINSTAPGNAVHTTGSLFTGSGPVTVWSGSFTIVDSASVSHTLPDGGTITGLAAGSTTSVNFVGTYDYVEDGETFRCTVDKLISANFVVQ